MKLPGPDHPITVEPAKTRWRVRYAGHVIADTSDALILTEAAYPPVVYFPRDDVAMEYLSRTAHSTHCPYKGDASYYSILMDGELAENAIWTYEEPFAAMEEIRGRLAFYPNRAEIYEVDDAAVNPRHAAQTHAESRPEAHDGRPVTVDEVVQHTDSGSGAAQREPWPANVETPSTTDDGGLR